MKPTTLALIIFSTTILARDNSLQRLQPKKPCGKVPQAVLHDLAHCILFFIPEGHAHPEEPWHFLYCCPWSGILIRIIESFRSKGKTPSPQYLAQLAGNQQNNNFNQGNQGNQGGSFQYKNYQAGNFQAGFSGGSRQRNWPGYSWARYNVNDLAGQENENSEQVPESTKERRGEDVSV